MKNGNVVCLEEVRQARTSSSLRAAKSAKASRVISDTPRSVANRDSASQCAEGIPRTRQLLTVGSACDSADATALVPPRELITESGVIMEGTIVCTVQTCQGFATRKTTFGPECDAINGMMDPPDKVARRLKALRKELGFSTQVGFAAKLGIDKSTYNPFEKGTRPLTFETACLIRRHFGISIDWLFFGDLQQSAIQTMAKIGRGDDAPAEIGTKIRRAAQK